MAKIIILLIKDIKRNQCLCQSGYYYDEINLPCLPICGDQIIVDEEDCDDGNNDPFDGLYQCQFKCQDECQVCFKDKCYQFKDNYKLIEAIYSCIQICNDQQQLKMINAMIAMIINLMDVIFVNFNIAIILSILQFRKFLQM
ncbi:unnamed protein product [Paramecium primaurelia]|uniref:Transmembrane protein n=1 Tax=Paramecium primaurelia TaxID=5886 RepID=A0A8S1MQ09_PARPR|nr:unnamed protein product [Paramecium primaurelia]